MTAYRGIELGDTTGVVLSLYQASIDQIYEFVDARIQQATYDNRVFNEVTQEFDDVPLTEDQIKALYVEMILNNSASGIREWRLLQLSQ